MPYVDRPAPRRRRLAPPPAARPQRAARTLPAGAGAAARRAVALGGATAVAAALALPRLGAAAVTAVVSDAAESEWVGLATSNVGGVGQAVQAAVVGACRGARAQLLFPLDACAGPCAQRAAAHVVLQVSNNSGALAGCALGAAEHAAQRTLADQQAEAARLPYVLLGTFVGCGLAVLACVGGLLLVGTVLSRRAAGDSPLGAPLVVDCEAGGGLAPLDAADVAAAAPLLASAGASSSGAGLAAGGGRRPPRPPARGIVIREPSASSSSSPSSSSPSSSSPSSSSSPAAPLAAADKGKQRAAACELTRRP